MSIYGIGTDITTVTRFERLLNRFGDRFAQRLLTPLEHLQYLASKSPARFLAKSFAAKEALFKALGTGMRNGLSFQHFEVSRDKLGKPSVKAFGQAKQIIEQGGVNHIHLSLTDEDTLVMAFVVIEKG